MRGETAWAAMHFAGQLPHVVVHIRTTRPDQLNLWYLSTIEQTLSSSRAQDLDCISCGAIIVGQVGGQVLLVDHEYLIFLFSQRT
jgi:hypothetical protein